MEKSNQKTILVIYHSQSGTMKQIAKAFVRGAKKVENIHILCKQANDVLLEDLLNCHGIAIGSPEYFGYMAGLIKDFFDRTYEEAEQITIGLPYMIFVCAGNDGRGAITQIERIVKGYNWKKVHEHYRVVGTPQSKDLAHLEEMGQTLAAGVEVGIY